MKFLLVGVALASALPSNKEISEDGWLVPQLDGTFLWTSVEDAFKKMDELLQETIPSPVVEFYLYTISNLESQQIYSDDLSGLIESNFNPSNPTKFYIHGWLSNCTAEDNIYIRTAYLSTGAFNVFCIDWSEAANSSYFLSVHHVPTVGKKVAVMIKFLRHMGGLSLDHLTVIGHGLGAHVAGFAAEHVTGGQIHSIIGLDPAFPLYSYDDCETRLCVTDAYYVESIHTDGDLLGFLKPIGRAAFYPNGGKSQPLGCGGHCGHKRAYFYYAEAIRMNDFVSRQCACWKKAIIGECEVTYSTSVRMGATGNPDHANGTFYTPVNENPPHGKG